VDVQSGADAAARTLLTFATAVADLCAAEFSHNQCHRCGCEEWVGRSMEISGRMRGRRFLSWAQPLVLTSDQELKIRIKFEVDFRAACDWAI